MSLSFTLKNLEDVERRANGLVEDLTRGPDVRSFGERLRKIVARQYDANFTARGSKFGAKWVTASGNTVSLEDTTEFRQSFKRLVLVTNSEGSGKVTIGFANPLVKSGMRTPFHQALSEIESIKIDVRGPLGGIARDGQPAVQRAFQTTARESAKRAGYKIR